MQGVSAFTGRATELDVLRRGVRSGSTTLVVGEAGIGKTRLVAECAAEFDAAGWLVVPASCLPLAEQLPLLPVVDALRQLHLLDGGALLRGCLEDSPSYVRGDLASLVPGLTSPSTGAAGGERPRQRLFAAVLQCWEAVRRRQPLMIIIEDLHWSDGTTRDFLTYVSAQYGTGSVPLVFTSRPGDVAEDGAAEVWSRGLVSTGRWQQLPLTPLTPHEVEEMAASVAPNPLSADQIAALVRRSDGNPFFVEQLLASDEVTMLSEELAQLLRSRAATTTPAAHEVLRVLAVAGRPLSDDELSAVTGDDAERVRGALRELVGATLARMSGDGLCTLRHALLGEAIESGLFAGERAELHAAVAALLLERADPSLAAEAAHHLRRAGRGREELPVRIAAAEYGEQVRGFQEASRHWARAVDLAEEYDDEQVAEFALRTLRAAGGAGSAERFLDQSDRGKRAAARLGQRQLYAAILFEAATLHSTDGTLERGLAELQVAVDAFKDLPPSTEQVSALIGLYWLHRGGGSPADGMPYLQLAVEMEEELGKNFVAALATLAHARLMEGEIESGLGALAEARQRVGVDADDESLTRLALAEADTCVKLNRLDEAATNGLAEWHRLRANGLTDTYLAAMLLSTVAEALRGRGRLDQLRRIVEPLTTDQTVGPASWKMHEQRCWVDLYGGRLDEATDRVDQILSRSCQRSCYDRSDMAQLRLELALWRNDPQAAVDVVRPVVESMAGARDEGWAARLLTSAMWACADLAEDGRDRRDEGQVLAGQQAAVQLEAVRADLSGDPFAQHPFFVTATTEGREWVAELDRCRGDNQPDLWLDVAREWDTFNRPHRAGYAWWRAAQAQLNLGHRGAAASALQTAYQRSEQHRPLADAVRHLARLSSVSLQEPSTAPERSDRMPAAPMALGLTSRELDVLRLLTEGLTNAEIGSRLYMSPRRPASTSPPSSASSTPRTESTRPPSPSDSGSPAPDPADNGCWEILTGSR